VSAGNRDDVVARLLTDAHEAVGVQKVFSAAQLKKFRQRYMRDMLKLAKSTNVAGLLDTIAPNLDNSTPSI
jgi:hypothetical protein